MRSLVISLIVIALSIVVVVASSIFVSGTLGGLEERAEAAIISEDSVADAANIYGEMLEDYKEKLPILLLLLPDSALYEIEGCFGDVINYAKADDYAGAITAKARLHSAIERMRVLTEFSLKSVF